MPLVDQMTLSEQPALYSQSQSISPVRQGLPLPGSWQPPSQQGHNLVNKIVDTLGIVKTDNSPSADQVKAAKTPEQPEEKQTLGGGQIILKVSPAKSLM